VAAVGRGVPSPDTFGACGCGSGLVGGVGRASKSRAPSALWCGLGPCGWRRQDVQNLEALGAVVAVAVGAPGAHLVMPQRGRWPSHQPLALALREFRTERKPRKRTKPGMLLCGTHAMTPSRSLAAGLGALRSVALLLAEGLACRQGSAFGSALARCVHIRLLRDVIFLPSNNASGVLGAVHNGGARG
jgi:hypothetical protein